MNYKRKYKKRVYKKKRTYKKRNASRISRNTSTINKLVKSTLVRTYWRHNDDARVDTKWPSVSEPEYRSFTPLVPSEFELLFNKMSNYTQQQKVRINGARINITLTLANSFQALQPVDYSVFCVKIKPRMRAQFYQQTSGEPTHTINLIRDIHYTGNLPAFQGRVAGTGANNLANIRLNPDIFDIHYYKHGYFSTAIKNQTAVGSGVDSTTKLNVKRCNFYIPYKCDLKSDSWNEQSSGPPTNNRYWTDLTQDEIPLFNRYHIFLFTSANYQIIPNTTNNNLLQSNIQCLFNATSAN